MSSKRRKGRKASKKYSLYLTIKAEVSFCTYNGSWSGGQHTVEHQRGDETFFLCSRVRLHQLSILTEEPLDMHLKSVSAFEVVGKQHCPGHDDKLKIQHGHTEGLAGLQSSAGSLSTLPPSPSNSPGVGIGKMCVPGSASSGL